MDRKGDQGFSAVAWHRTAALVVLSTFSGAAIAGLLFLLDGSRAWWSVGYYVLVGGLVLGTATSMLGGMVYARLGDGSPAMQRANRHIAVVLTAMLFFVVAVAVQKQPAATVLWKKILWALALYGGWLILLGGAYLGRRISKTG